MTDCICTGGYPITKQHSCFTHGNCGSSVVHARHCPQRAVAERKTVSCPLCARGLPEAFQQEDGSIRRADGTKVELAVGDATTTVQPPAPGVEDVKVSVYKPGDPIRVGDVVELTQGRAEVTQVADGAIYYRIRTDRDLVDFRVEL